MVKLVLDCFGGDNSPGANVQGAVSALGNQKDLYLVLTGDEEKIKSELSHCKYDKERLEIVNAPDVIGCDEKPTDAIRLKKESSMMKAVYLCRTDDSIKGMISVGSTGALVAAATVRIGRLREVIRPAFCPILPTMNGGIVAISDSGANVECNSEELLQFAAMGSIYLEKVYPDYIKGEKPKVALLNVGTEAEKGDDMHREAYARLKSASENGKINFVGNMESRDLLGGKYNLVVCDGFTGNVLIKSTEGACLEILKRLKKDIMSRLRYKIGALLMKSMFDSEKEFFNYQNYGGSVLLGVNKVIVKGHGSSKAKAIEKCIEQAYRMASVDLCEETEKLLSGLSDTKEGNENV